MWQVLAFIAAFALLVATAKIAILVLIIAGLIFRTKETVGFLLFCALITAFTNHPWIFTAIVVPLVITGYYLRRKEEAAKREKEEALSNPNH